MGGKKRSSIRMLATGDWHCGHKVGLTPPGWWSPKQSKVRGLQEETWDWFVSEVERLKPIDILVVNGDVIDGKGSRSGGTELITTDRNEQIEIALESAKFLAPKTVVVTAGTPYHTGVDEDWERLFEIRCRDSIKGIKAVHFGGHEFLEIGGTVFDFKHKIGASQVPHGRFTALARDMLWNVLWADMERQPRADVVVRNHVHYYIAIATSQQCGFVLPALQAAGTKFGGRQCSGIVDYGFVHFDIAKGGYTWQPHLFVPPSEIVHPLPMEQLLGVTL